MPLVSTASFVALLEALELSQGLFKPIPSALNASIGAVNSVSGTVNDTTSSLGLPLPNLNLSLIGTLQNGGKTPPAIAKVKSLNTESSSCQVSPYNASPIDDLESAPFDSVKSNIYRYRQQQSVNLGSWFVHEDWMTPSLFACAAGKRASEHDIAMGWGTPENARTVLERHWDSFITRSDFEYLASIGINTVRLPIGYWSLGPVFCQGTDFEPVADVYRNSWPRVLRAINWAADFGIGVLVDLHGAPGSQNGQSHSGISDGKTNLFNDPYNQKKTIEILSFLAQQLATVTNVVGIQLLNEPVNAPGLPAFYDQAIGVMRRVSAQAQSLPLYIHDGFNLERFSAYVSGRQDFVVQDHHSYFVFTPSDASKPARLHMVDIETKTSSELESASLQERRNLVIGEWSCALTPESLRSEDNPDGARKQFCTGQMDVYNNETAGWAFWSYKMELADPGWSFNTAVGVSLPSTFFSYGQTSMPAESKLLTLASAALSGLEAPSSRGPSSADVKRRHPTRVDRFYFVHERRQSDDLPMTTRNDAITPGSGDATSTKGYSDGFMTAKLFAAQGLSKLGFIDQYINDSIAALGPSAVPMGVSGVYREAFKRGLKDGEGAISTALGQ